MMRLVRAGGYPWNLLETVFGIYERKDNETRAYWERKIQSFIRDLERGGDEQIARDWSMCQEYFDGTVGFMEIAKRRDIPEPEVSRGIYRMCEYLSMYWRDNPNFSASTQFFLSMVIGRTGDTRAVDILRAAGITSNNKLLTYCQKHGTGFERIPALKESSKKEIQSWVRNTSKEEYHERRVHVK